MMPWSQPIEPLLTSFLRDPSEAKSLPSNEGAESYKDQAVAKLEMAFAQDRDTNEESRRKECDEAAQLLSKAIEAAPWDWYARTLYRDITELDLKEIPAVIHADRICWHVSDGDREEMEAEFEKAMSFRKDYELALYNYAMSLRQIGYQEDSIRALDELIKINPRHSQANFDLALDALQQSNEESEMKYYEISVSNDQYFTFPLYNLGKTYEDRGDLKLAKTYYEKALKLYPYYVEPIEQLGFIAHREGQSETAAKYFIRALQADPLRKETYQHAAWFAEQSGNKELLKFAADLFKFHMPREFYDFWG